MPHIQGRECISKNEMNINNEQDIQQKIRMINFLELRPEVSNSNHASNERKRKNNFFGNIKSVNTQLLPNFIMKRALLSKDSTKDLINYNYENQNKIHLLNYSSSTLKRQSLKMKSDILFRNKILPMPSTVLTKSQSLNLTERFNSSRKKLSSKILIASEIINIKDKNNTKKNRVASNKALARITETEEKKTFLRMNKMNLFKSCNYFNKYIYQGNESSNNINLDIKKLAEF